MELCRYTDSVPDRSLDEALDLSMAVGGTAVEIAAGGQSTAPHMNVFERVEDAGKRAEFARKLSSRGLRMGAVELFRVTDASAGGRSARRDHEGRSTAGERPRHRRVTEAASFIRGLLPELPGLVKT
jgi:sugar phosphate isomerase/epimerase